MVAADQRNFTAVIFAIAIVALIAQIVYDLVQHREKKRDSKNVKTALHRPESDNDKLRIMLNRIEIGLNQLVAERKITKQELQLRAMVSRL
jgi:nitrogen fixation protein FixH